MYKDIDDYRQQDLERPIAAMHAFSGYCAASWVSLASRDYAMPQMLVLHGEPVTKATWARTLSNRPAGPDSAALTI